MDLSRTSLGLIKKSSECLSRAFTMGRLSATHLHALLPSPEVKTEQEPEKPKQLVIKYNPPKRSEQLVRRQRKLETDAQLKRLQTHRPPIDPALCLPFVRQNYPVYDVSSEDPSELSELARELHEEKRKNRELLESIRQLEENIVFQQQGK